ncbi:MAG: phosphoglucosamine mutase [Planctomycetota bacterium]
MTETAPHTDAPLMVSVSGCRGIVGASLTPDVIARFCSAWASEVRARTGARKPRIVVGRDGRAGGHALLRLAEGALNMAGCDVIRLGVAMTPSVGLMVHRLSAEGGLVLTASHNPGEWNGIKPITEEGGAPLPEQARSLIHRFHEGAPEWVTPERLGGLTEDHSTTDAHVARVLDAIAAVQPLESIRECAFKVVVDSVNASGAAPAAAVLEALGCRVTHLNADGTGIFPHTPEPTAANLTSLCGAVREHGGDVGFAQDPDGDRLALVDELGAYVGEEYTLVLGAMAYLGSLSPSDARNARLAANLSTSRMIDDVAAQFGASVVRTPVGEANVVSGMRAAGAAFGGEGNGGVIWRDIVPIRDSIVSMALTLALMAREGRPLSMVVADVPRYAIEKRKAPAEAPLVARLADAVRDLYDGADVDEQDGVRLDFEAPSGSGRAWLHVRPSNTEPIVRLIAEAPTAEDAKAILDKAEAALR